MTKESIVPQTITLNNAYAPGLIIKGALSQSANLQEWQVSDGTVIASISRTSSSNNSANFLIGGGPDWKIGSNELIFGRSGGTSYINHPTDFYLQSVYGGKLIVKGPSGQTANLQEWQNSAGTVLAKVTSAGNIFSANNFESLSSDIYIKNTSGQVFRSVRAGAWTDSADALFFQVGANSDRIAFTANVGTTATRMLFASTFTTISNYSYNTTPVPTAVTNLLSSTDAVVLKVQGSSSQTANLQEWQDSSGANLALIASGGFFHGTGFRIKQNANSTISSAQGSIEIQGSTVRGLVIVGATSQSAHLQEWQNSAGTVLAIVNSTGEIRAPLFGSVSSGKALLYTSASATNEFRIDTNGSTNKGLVIRAAASQTANIQEWQSSAGTVLSYINNVGAANFVRAGIGGATPGTTALFVTATSASGIGVIARAAASQTANIQEWQITDGTVRSFINPIGRMGVRLSELAVGTESLSVGTVNTTDIGIVVRGVASQTANLQEWQNSVGTVLTSISSTGKLTSAVDASINGVVIGMGAGSASTNTAVGLNSLVSNTTGISNTAFGNQSLQLNTSGTQNTAFGQGALYNNRTGWYNTAFGQGALQNSNYAYSNTAIGVAAMITNVSGGGNTAVGIQSLLSNLSGGNNVGLGSNAGFSNSTGSGNIFLGNDSGYYETGSNKLYIANTNTTTPLIGGDFSAKTLTIAGNATIISQATGTVGLIVKAIASQTSNVFEVQNSSGSTQLSVNQFGVTRALAGGYITTNSASGVVLYVDGVASQTANLQEWRNSAATVLAKVDKDGNFSNVAAFGSVNAMSVSAIGGNITTTYGFYSNLSASTDAGVAVQPWGANIRGALVKGFTSQTADLHQWQNSAGTVLVKIAADGATSFPGGNVDIHAGGNFTVRASGATAWYQNASALIGTGYAGGIGLIVRGSGSQTADLQQWQSSAGTVIAKVDTYGYITSNGAILPSGNGSFESAYGGAFMAMKKVTSAVANPVADVARMYLVAGTNAGTLKLVIKAGAAGAETTILDNIPQS